MISLNDFIWDVVSAGPHELRLHLRVAPGMSERVARLLTHHGVASASPRSPLCVQVLNAKAQRETLDLLGVLRGPLRVAFDEWAALRATRPVCWVRVGALNRLGIDNADAGAQRRLLS